MRITKDMIDPELRLPGAIANRIFGGSRSIDQLRRPNGKLFAVLSKIPIGGLRKTDVSLQRPDGTDLRLLVVTPPTVRPNAPSVFWIHGGGYAQGTPDAELSVMKSLVDLTGCIIVSPDYRLSGQAPYPAGLDDCYAALLWLRDNTERLGGRADQIIVGGASAGGGMTAALTLLARDRDEVRIAFQCPLYPMLDDRETTSSRDNNAPIWDQPTNQNAWTLYHEGLDKTSEIPAYAAPARATNFVGLPPTITFVGGVEAFRDETIAYVEALRSAAVPTEFRLIPGAWHAFDGLAAWTTPAKTARRWFLGRFVEYVTRFTAPQHSGE